MKSENQNSILFGDEANSELATALSNLKRVDAPGDFDFKLKARIAQSRPGRVRRTGMLLAAKFALPVVVLLGFGAFLIISNADDAATVAVDPVVDQTMPTVREAEQPNRPSGEPNGNLVAVNPQSPTSATQTNKGSNTQPPVGSSVDRPTDGSFDRALSSEDTIYPRGINPDFKATTSNVPSNSQLAVTELLSMLGISGEFSGGGFVVQSVSPNSVAARVGVRSGDVIEAINERNINAQTVFSGAFVGKNIRISRDGQRMNLNLGS